MFSAAGAECGTRKENDLRRYLVILGALALLLSMPQVGLAGGAGTYLASFLEVDAGARQMGLGGAFTGLADDAMCVFYNPAGLRFLEGSEIHLENTTWPAGVSYQHLSYGFRHSYIPGAFALSWAVLQINPYAEKTEYYDPESDFEIGIGDPVDAGDMAFGGSYCWSFTDWLSVGATVRWYHLGMAEAFCEGVMGDIGVLYDTPIRNLRLGASILNVGPENRWANTGSEGGFGEYFAMPRTYRAGASMRIFDVVTHKVVLSADYKRPASGENKFNFGTEYTFNRGRIFVFGRAGYRMNYDEEGLTLGLGTLFPSSAEGQMRLDYTYVDMGNLETTHRMAVTFIF